MKPTSGTSEVRKLHWSIGRGFMTLTFQIGEFIPKQLVNCGVSTIKTSDNSLLSNKYFHKQLCNYYVSSSNVVVLCDVYWDYA